MNILITVPTYWPYKDGLQNVTQYQAEGLKKLGHSVTVITNTNPNIVESESIHNGIKIIRYPIRILHSIYIGNKKKYRNLILSLQCDFDCMINVATECPYTDWLLPILKRIKCKKILIEHGISSTRLKKSDFISLNQLMHGIWRCLRFSFLYKIQGNNIKQYDYVTNLHEFAFGNSFLKNKIGDKLKILYNGVDAAFFNAEINIQKDIPDNYVLCVANYGYGKNQIDTLKTFYESGLENISMIFIGSSNNAYLEKLIRFNEELSKLYKKNLDIRFLHDIPREAMPNIVHSAKIVILNSRSEHFPITICEAMASGIPFISTNVGIVKYLPGGVIVDSVESGAYWLKCLYKNPTIAHALGVCGKEFANKNLKIEDKVLILNKLIIGKE